MLSGTDSRRAHMLKSATLTRQELSTSRLGDLRSRCTMPILCRYSMPLAASNSCSKDKRNHHHDTVDAATAKPSCQLHTSQTQ